MPIILLPILIKLANLKLLGEKAKEKKKTIYHKVNKSVAKMNHLKHINSINIEYH